MQKKLILIISLIWVFFSLFVAEELLQRPFADLSDLQASLLWVPLAAAPFLPFAWLWLVEKSPWNKIFMTLVVIVGGTIMLISLNDWRTEEWVLIPILWTGVAAANAYVLKDRTRVTGLFASPINLSGLIKAKPPASTTTGVEIDHIRYLKKLDDQIAIGMASAMRVRQQFIEKLPEALVTLNLPSSGTGSAQFTPDSPFTQPQIQSFMTEKLATELTFICTMAFLDRVCGPDFRYTKQYDGLREFFLSIKTSEQGLPAPAIRDELKMNTILASSDLDDALKSLDHVVAKSSDELSASNVTVSLAGLRHIVLSGLVMKDQMNDDQIGKMVYAGMVRSRDMFKNTKTAI